MEQGIKLGSISACIDGDRRYTSKIDVYLVGDEVIVQRLENGPVRVMDGGSTCYAFAVHYSTIAPSRDPKAIVSAIKRAMDSTIKRYGKPTKMFTWVGVKEKGLSVAKCLQALTNL